MADNMFNEYYDTKLGKKAHPELRFFDRKKIHLGSAKHIHIIGICGTAMGTFALMLRDSGFTVSGSDAQFWPPMGPLLRSSGVEIFEGWNAAHIADDVDLVVVGNACGPTHVEVVAAQGRGLALMSMPEILGEYYIGDEKTSLVVAGTHGKTTTTGLLSHVLSVIDENPTYLIGGVMQSMNDSGTSHHVGKGKYVALEGDEYDTAFFDARPKFLHYRPSFSIITSVEWDHVDIYASIEEYKTAFAHLIEVTKKGLVVSDQYPLLNELIANIPHQAEVLVYGMDEKADLKPVLGETNERGQEFELFIKEKTYGKYITPMYGEYNVLNTVAVLGLLHQAGFDIASDEIKKAVAGFPGMKRRQEIVDEILIKNSSEKVTIIDDFAHHPTAVSETLKGIRNRFPNRRLVALFEPRSNTSRRKMFEHTYPGALAIADLIGIKTPPYRAEVDAGQDLLDPHVIERDVQALGKEIILTETTDELVTAVSPHILPGDVIVVMSNGAFDGIHGMIADALQA
jgi:UDP-N-acetylmuramate: L-alanyl-gamma-D-glutamyl-meso-diaminopimelate ligase